MPKKIAKVVVTLPVEGPFDYEVPESYRMQIALGQRVYVPFGNRNIVGFVVGVRNKSRVKQLKSILSILDNIPALNDDMLKITKEFSQYYGCSWGEAIETSLPSALRKRKELQLEMPEEKGERVSLKGELVLCHDKGRTQRWPFILEQIKSVILKGQGVVVLVPETYLINKTKKFIEEQCNIPVSILDRKMTPKKELEQWISVKEGRGKIVIGTRSAVFAPVSKLGLIIILEEENWSYKQEQSPFYHTSHIAKMRALQEGNSVIFVSSAPSAELWWKVQKGEASVRTLEPDKVSKMQVIDMSNYKFRGKAVVSFPLQNYIQETLSAKGKVLLFLNRRGFSTMTRCNKCSFIIKCDRCNVSMSYLFAKKKLVCHLCNNEIKLPKVCPECKSSYLRSSGTGIEKLESDLARIFPHARIEQFDRETKGIPKKTDIIIATQAIFRVIEDINISLIGVLDVDAELNRFDFRSAQKVFSLLVRLRQAAKDKIAVQTYQNKNYCLKAIRDMDFDNFYRCEIKLRRECGFPPFKHLVAIMLRGPKEDVVLEKAKDLFNRLEKNIPKGIEILDFQPDMVPKLRDKYRFTIMLKGKPVKRMLSFVKSAVKASRKKKNVIVTINVDP